MGGQAIGQAAGGLAAQIQGGPGGAVLGGVLGAGLSAALGDIVNRRLSRREEERVGGVALYAIRAIQRRLDDGERPRADEFFQSSNGQPPPAEELFDAVLQAASREYQRKKLPLLGNLMASLVFSNGVVAADANLQIRRAERLSYRQLCLLATIARRWTYSGDGRFSTKTPAQAFALAFGKNANSSRSREIATLFQEAFEIYKEGLLRVNSDGTIEQQEAEDLSAIYAPTTAATQKVMEPAAWHDMIPDLLLLTTEGQFLAKLIGSYNMAEDDLLPISELLCYDGLIADGRCGLE